MPINNQQYRAAIGIFNTIQHLFYQSNIPNFLNESTPAFAMLHLDYYYYYYYVTPNDGRRYTPKPRTHWGTSFIFIISPVAIHKNKYLHVIIIGRICLLRRICLLAKRFNSFLLNVNSFLLSVLCDPLLLYPLYPRYLPHWETIWW